MEETWFVVIVTLCINSLIQSVFKLFLLPPLLSTKDKLKKRIRRRLPPGPSALRGLLRLNKPAVSLQTILQELRSKYGPFITLKTGLFSEPEIYVGSHSLAFRALVQNSSVFSDRPRSPDAHSVFTSNQHNINTAFYGSFWRLIRRNLSANILHQSRVKCFSGCRKKVLKSLINRLLNHSINRTSVQAYEEFFYTIFSLVALMCYGENLEEKDFRELEAVHQRIMDGFVGGPFTVLMAWPRLGKFLFRNKWNQLLQVRQHQVDVYMSYIKDRIREKEEGTKSGFTYVDTLLDLEVQEKEQQKRKLTQGEMVSLCSEFLFAGTDMTSTAMQWIMANLVKYPNIQAKVYEEIAAVMGGPPSSSYDNETAMRFVREKDQQRMPYLKAVVLEGLRRHPPMHILLPHSVTEEVVLDGYDLPKNTTVHFLVAEMGRDPKVWEDPMAFKPERFLTGSGEVVFDITGSREIKMMPFGAGRRICPAFNLGILHLEYFIANMIWYFEWRNADGGEIDLTDKHEASVVMKNPLKAHLYPRFKFN
uniref:Cytochrome P450 n=1 Tax=Nothapodytes nimmoniana TaxID=159386 RepID=A0A7L7RB74_NOTNI|nr:cytochrome P450 [Nothapodytes nimmoniana]